MLWGKEFVDTFLNVTLPIQLDKNNLPLLLETKSLYRIFTTKTDLERMKKSTVFQKLSTIIEVEIVLFELEKSSKYTLSTLFHQEAVDKAWKENKPLIFLTPDAIFSSGFIKRILQSSEKYRALFCPSLRVSRNAFLQEISKESPEYPDQSFHIENRKLVKVALNTVHPIVESLMYGKPYINKWPSHLYWKIDEEALWIKGFHLHPLYIWPTEHVKMKSTIDDDFILSACPNPKDWDFIEDSDDLFICDLTEESLTKEIKYMKNKDLWLHSWAFRHAAKHHKQFVKSTTLIHARDLTTKEISSKEAFDQIMEKIMKKNPFRTYVSCMEYAYLKGRRFAGMLKNKLIT